MVTILESLHVARDPLDGAVDTRPAGQLSRPTAGRLSACAQPTPAAPLRAVTSSSQILPVVVTWLQTEAELKAADARASDTQQLADSLLAQHYNEWVPHWVADGYERVRRFPAGCCCLCCQTARLRAALLGCCDVKGTVTK